MKTLITYSYFERSDPIVRENLEFFLKFGLLENNTYDYVFAINGGNCSVEIPEHSNLTVIKRNNTCRDFGAYSASLYTVNPDSYDYFIFINDTCRGPFIPTYVPTRVNWVEMFLDKLDHQVKLVGPTWFRHNLSYIIKKESLPNGFTCIPPGSDNSGLENWFKAFFGEDFGELSHIQTMAFGTDRLGLDLARSSGIFNLNRSEGSRESIIRNNEIGLSRCILDNGYKIRPFQLSQFTNVFHEDIHKTDAYFGTTLNPFDVMFIKTNRINNQVVRNYTKWLMERSE